jgi:hypothetical protein
MVRLCACEDGGVTKTWEERKLTYLDDDVLSVPVGQAPSRFHNLCLIYAIACLMSMAGRQETYAD